jgi:predicted metalloprotease with PDZ domain
MAHLRQREQTNSKFIPSEVLMLRLLICLLACSCVASAECRFAHTKRADVVTYRFTPSFETSGLRLHVTLNFQMNAKGIQTLALPREWAGEKLNSMSHLQATSAGSFFDGSSASGEVVLHGLPNHLVVVEYDLQRDWSGPLVNPLQFHPVLMPQYLEFTGSNALVRRVLGDNAAETANFDWQSLPLSWTLATSFGTSAEPVSRCQTFTGPWNRVQEGLYAAGDFRIHSFRINSQSVYLAIRGSWTFTDDEAIQDIQKTIGIVRDFWRDYAFPYYLVTVSPFDRDHGSADGSEFTNAFWMFVPRLDRLDGLLPTLAHESFHTWNPGKMGMVPTGYDENAIKWFREGPTDYYGQLLTYRAGLLSTSDYVDSLNIALRRFPTTDDEYVRGRVIALWIDGTIRSESDGRRSLDNVMFDLVNQKDQPYTLERILAVINRYLSPPSQAKLQEAVSRHGALPAPAELPVLSSCAKATLGNYPTFDLGFDIDKSQTTKVVSGVVDGGPAFRAGLRDGDKLLGFSYSKHDPDRQAHFTIASAGGTKHIIYLPQGGPAQAWQYTLNSALSCNGLARH